MDVSRGLEALSGSSGPSETAGECPNCGYFLSSAKKSPTEKTYLTSSIQSLDKTTGNDLSKQSSIVSKLMRMKDALVDAIDTPVIAMWEDQSLAVMNTALARIMHNTDGPVSYHAQDIFGRFEVYYEDFSSKMPLDEWPIIRLCRDRTPFHGLRVGLIDHQMERLVFEMAGECVQNEKTGEFQAGVCTLKDVT